jgi:hypothetical protein
VTRFYSIDDATAALQEVEPILLALRDERAELIRLRDRALAGGGEAAAGDEGAVVEDSQRLLRLRMQGLIDQMQAAVTRLDELSVTLRDIESGLIDFPALVNGRQVWLCWRLGEGPVEWWHELDTGFASRQRLIDLA